MTTPYAVVVVLHDSEAELAALLRSFDAHLVARPEVVVVDSGSRDGGAGLARGWGAEVIVLDGNPGFGAACNAGCRASPRSPPLTRTRSTPRGC
jgi:glycosyltransferase involved in cell wall biosynthesis